MKRRRLGQHYLVDQRVVGKVIEEAGIRPSERVVEIGTGRGALTTRLAELSDHFEGYEVDRENYEKTLEALGGAKGRVHLGDAFREEPEFDVLVASLPYSRSADFVEWLSRARYDRAVVLLQEDFVKKILAKPGARDYRAVSVLAQMSSDVEIVDRVGRDAFFPRPKVSSVIVSFRPRLRLGESEIALVQRLFSLRRRRASSVLTQLGMVAGGYGKRRVYELAPDEVHRLCTAGAG